MKSFQVACFLLIYELVTHSLVVNCFAQSTKYIEIALIDFLYVSEGNRTAKQLERDIFILGLDRALNLVQAHDYKFKVKRVEKGNLEYFIYTQARERASISSYDIAVWGHVTPYDNLGDYDFQLMVFTNPDRIETCLFYYDLEIRDARIRRWNNYDCNMPETASAIIPSILIYKLISFLKKNEENTDYSDSNLEKTIRQNLLPLVESLPSNEVLNLHPNQNCDADILGSLNLELKNGERLVLPLNYQMYDLLNKNLAKNISYNWKIERTPRVAMREKAESGERWPWIAAGSGVIVGVVAELILGGGGGDGSSNKGSVRITIKQIQE